MWAMRHLWDRIELPEKTKKNKNNSQEHREFGHDATKSCLKNQKCQPTIARPKYSGSNCAVVYAQKKKSSWAIKQQAKQEPSRDYCRKVVRQKL